MDITLSIGLLLAVTGFWAWVLFLGGADWLEGTWMAEVFVHVGAGGLSSTALKILTTVIWLGEVTYFVVTLSMR
jgi:hypothetical protein